MISLRLIPNPELTQVILSYGADVRVVEPVSLRERIVEVWKRAASPLGIRLMDIGMKME